MLPAYGIAWLKGSRDLGEATWFNATSHALDVECTLSSMKEGSPDPPYTKALSIPTHVDDMHAFYAPGRFALDKSSLPNKSVERARASFWVGRDIEFVMAGKAGSAVWWDGNVHRKVMKNFYVEEHGFLDLSAPLRAPPREVESDSVARSTMIAPVEKSTPAPPLRLRRGRRDKPSEQCAA
ncbi:MAG: hypothetical protein SGPRY_012193, partial [Prymnesium sp.]